VPTDSLQTSCFLTLLAAGWSPATQWLPVDANAQADSLHEKGLQKQTFSQAAEGIRTLDLLHGKQTMGLSWAREMPGNEQLPRG
jgi:hypothetical protein